MMLHLRALGRLTPPFPRFSALPLATVSTRVRLPRGPTLVDNGDGSNPPVRGVHVACSVHLRSSTRGEGLKIGGKKSRVLDSAGSGSKAADQGLASRLQITSTDGESRGQSRTWRRNRWKVRRQRYMYDMLGLIKKGKVEEADSVFERMKIKHVHPDTAVFNTLIGAHGKKGELKKAFKLFNDLKKRGLLPSQHTYSSIFAACTAVGGPQGAEVLLRVQEEMERRNVILNIVSFNALMVALVKCGHPERSFEVYSSMSQLGISPSVETFSTLLLAASKDDQNGIDGAFRTWVEMRATGIQPDSQCYGSLLLCLRDAGVSSTLLEPCDHSTIVPPLTLGSRVTKLDAVPTEKVLHLVADGVVEVALDQDMHFKLLFISGKKRRWIENEGLDIFLDHMKKEGLRIDIKLCHILVSLVPDIEYLLQKMKSYGVAPDDHCILAAIRHKLLLGDQSGAKLLMKQLKGEGPGMEKQKAYQAVASTCHTTKDITHLLAEMKEQSITPNKFIFATLIGNAVRRRQYEGLVTLIKAMKHHEVVPSAIILEKLEAAAGYTHESEWVKRKQNGFKGYYNLWKRTMGVSEVTTS